MTSVKSRINIGNRFVFDLVQNIRKNAHFTGVFCVLCQIVEKIAKKVIFSVDKKGMGCYTQFRCCGTHQSNGGIEKKISKKVKKVVDKAKCL